MMGALAGSVFVGVMVLALLLAERRQSRLLRWVTKPLASAGFLVAAVGAGALDGRYGMTVLVALALCWLGDLLLIPESMVTFQLGLASFLAGHVCFAVAFVREGVDWRWAAGAAVVVCALAIVVGRWLLPHVERKMRPPVLAYIVVISCMVALAVGTVVAHGRPLILIAAITFFCSDLAVARDTFVKKEFVNRLWGLPVYYGACLLFAWSIHYPG